MSAVPNDLQPAAAPRRVKFFRNGANQAVRIPREFELPGDEATVRREGDALIIEPVEPVYPKGSVAALQQALRKLQALGPIDEEFPDVDEGLLPLDDIEL
ncbi:antitoxin [Ottowia testudinis]|uniref:AbrB/MazE/SpoVT family DNA-binding domain-containing protein n=1 Tax=Ottowia testudinis TaxID=2816950 RepID=A0A975CDJ7_9BURK|nr:AbrB/MazE/SpoVT family DNA-binding domain-containing protein [Ottowia testudinis]QTD43776.1 AbrB/MazE/SpoVT family DNA-binding domain-containing protein [Ottowia testudinis]